MYDEDDQAAREQQYDVTAHYGGLEAFREAHAAARAAANQKVRAELVTRLDLPYGAHDREKIDLFLPTEPGAQAAVSPLLIYIHGGYWRARDRSDFSFLAPPFVARGITFASIGYPLCPEMRLRRIVESCRRALVFLAAQAGALGIDADRLHVSGHSAGGHLAAMMMATDWRDFGLPGDLVKSGTAISGLYDLAPVALTRINDDIHLDEAEIADLSPIRLAPRLRGPLIVTVGGRETDAFIAQARAFAGAWAASGRMVVEEIPNPGFYHFNVVDTLGQAGSDLQARVLAAIDS